MFYIFCQIIVENIRTCYQQICTCCEHGLHCLIIDATINLNIYIQILGLDQLDCTVAILKNVTSGKLGCKDIIKIDREMDLDWDLIGYVDPSITVNIIRNGVRVEKKHLELPKKLVNVIHCKNPRCITSVEQELPQIFTLTDPATRTYRCLYCEAKAENA